MKLFLKIFIFTPPKRLTIDLYHCFLHPKLFPLYLRRPNLHRYLLRSLLVIVFRFEL